MSMKKFLLWYCMLTKRLFKKFSFIILLCCIPIMVLVTSSAMNGESGVLTILLCSEDENSGADEIIDSLLEKDSIILFKKSTNIESALNQVKQHKADAVWCFEDDFDEKVEKFATHESMNPLVTVYEREDSIPLQLSKEKLYGAIYSKFSYMVYKNFVYTKLVDESRLPEYELADYFNQTQRRDDIVELENAENEKNDTGTDYLMAPMRGILALLVILCGLAAAMYFLKDKRDGKFDWMPSAKRVIPAFAQCLSAIVPASVAVLIAVAFTGISVGIINELVSMLLFIVATTGFCLFMCMVFRSSGNLGAAIPALLIAMLVLSPVFFNLPVLKPLSMLLPTYYYLNCVYNMNYCLSFIAYIFCVYGLNFFINHIFKRN